MAALVESGMRNLDHGDRDSVGLFQMRLGTWNRGEYAGYPDKPELQLQWFLDRALEVKQQRVADGRSVTDPSQYGEWIADIERPAEAFRGRYQLRLDEASAMLDHPADPDVPSTAELVDVGGGDGPWVAPQATAALAEAQKYLGTPYHWGGSTPQEGFDCSGFVQWAYAKAGIRIPRTTDVQFTAPNGTSVARGDLVRGDVVFFRDPTGYIHHEGIYLGGGKFLHAPHTGDVVRVSSLDEPYYDQQFAGGRRFAAASSARPDPADDAPEPGISSSSAQAAMAAVTRDAAEARTPGTRLFTAVREQELRKEAIPAPP
jgi:hypothetical protein